LNSDVFEDLRKVGVCMVVVKLSGPFKQLFIADLFIFYLMITK